MIDLNLTALVSPVSAENPCGPDLAETGDVSFMNFMAYGEGLLPKSFFFERDDKSMPFDRGTVDFKGQFAAAKPWLEATRDLRLLSLLAKFHLLNRDLKGFAQYLAAIATLLEQQWDNVHPRGEDGDFAMRVAELQSLDDMAPIVLPMQHVHILKPARGAPLAFRSQLIASGEIVARNGEEHPDANGIDRVIKEVDIPQIVEARDLVQAVADALATIRNVFVERIGFENAIKYTRLPSLVDKMLAFLNENLARRDPSLAQPVETDTIEGDATGSAPSGGSVRPGQVTTVAAAAAALAGIENYFSLQEPSNPALLLVRQAKQLIGKSFLDAMRVLAPELVDLASVALGRTESFSMPLNRFGELAENQDTPVPELEQLPVPEVRGRSEVNGLLTEISLFYGRQEPSSPIPFLTDRAKALTGRDFISILKDILPENTLRTPN